MASSSRETPLAMWEPGSSEVDWCEEDYKYSQYIAEFYNTISNVPFFILPPILIFLFRHYARRVDSSINVIWCLLIIVGAGSGYFHATLSFSGQLLDELAILYVLMAALALWSPTHWFACLGSRDTLKKVALVMSVIITRLAFVFPAVNAFVLMGVGAPCVASIFIHLKSCTDPVVWRLAYMSVFWWVGALVCWFNDRFACGFWRSFSFPYPQLHSWWHVLVLLASYTGCVLGAYFFACTHTPQLKPRLAHWPQSSWQLGVPYVALMDDSRRTRGGGGSRALEPVPEGLELELEKLV